MASLTVQPTSPQVEEPVVSVFEKAPHVLPICTRPDHVECQQGAVNADGTVTCLREIRKTIPCRYFFAEGARGCYYGDECFFSHTLKARSGG